MCSRVVLKWASFDEHWRVISRIKIFAKLFHVSLINISLTTHWIRTVLTLYMTSENMNLAFKLRCVGDEIYAGIYEWKWSDDVIKCAQYSDTHWTPNALRVSTNVIHEVVPYDFIARGWRAASQSTQHPHTRCNSSRAVEMWTTLTCDSIFFSSRWACGGDMVKTEQELKDNFLKF